MTLCLVPFPTKIDAVFDELDDDGGGSLDLEELRVGMKVLIDSAKHATTSNAALEKRAAALRKAAASQIAALAMQEKASPRPIQRSNLCVEHIA